MKSEKKLKIARILFIISFIITIYFINGTYSKYQEKINTNYDVDVKQWKILVNNEDIHTTEKQLSEFVTPVFVSDENSADGVLVPGKTGYFQTEIDYTNVQVPFLFTFTLQQPEEDKQLPDFKFFKYSVMSDASDSATEELSFDYEVTPNPDGEDKVTAVRITPPDNTLTKKAVIRTYFTWYDAIDNEMDNYDDTTYRLITNSEGTLNFLANASFSQAGKNLFNIDDIEETEYLRKDGNNITIKGKYNNRINNIFKDLTPNTQYTISYNITGYRLEAAGSIARMKSGDTNPTYVGGGYYNTRSYCDNVRVVRTFTVPENIGDYYAIMYGNNNSEDEITFSNIQIEEGTEATAYENYIDS